MFRTPKSSSIQNTILEWIFSEKYACGEMLPPIHTLSSIFKTSDKTVKSALTNLKRRNIIKGINGKGIVVVKEPRHIGKGGVGICYVNEELDAQRYFSATLDEYSGNNRTRDDYLIKKTVSSSDFIETLQTLWQQTGRSRKHNDAMLFFQDIFLTDVMQQSLLKKINFINFSELGICPGLLNPVTRGNDIFALPLFYSPVMLCINKGICEKIGLAVPDNFAGFSEFSSLCSNLTERQGSKTVRYGFAVSPSAYRFPAIPAAFGGSLTAGRTNGQSERAVRAFESIYHMVKYDKSIIIAGTCSESTAEELFRSEKAAMILISTYYLDKLASNKLPFKIITLPVPKEPEGKDVYMAEYMGIPAHTENISNAAQFSNFFFSSDFKKKFSGMFSTCHAGSVSLADNKNNSSSGSNSLMIPIEDAIFLGRMCNSKYTHVYADALALLINDLFSPEETIQFIEKRIPQPLQTIS